VARSKRTWALADRPGHLVMRLSRLMARLADARLSPLGVGVASYPVFSILSRQGGLTQKQLTEMLNVEQSSMAQLLGRMERDGFIVRKKDPADARSSLIYLTELATATFPKIEAIMAEGNDLAVNGMTDAQIDMSLELLRRMIANLEALER
jgi:MarR family transcriptional regulator for hemolysin